MNNHDKIKKITNWSKSIFHFTETFRNIYRSQRKRYPFFTDDDNKTYSPFFIIGSGRSGNTLLRSMLCRHSRIGIPPESYHFGEAIKVYSHYSYLNWHNLVGMIISQFASHGEFKTWNIDITEIFAELAYAPEHKRSLFLIISKLYGLYNKKYFPSADLWGDKTPSNAAFLNFINLTFPNAKYIHIIRDGRDVANSYFKSAFFKGDFYCACNEWKSMINVCEKLVSKKGADNAIEVRYEHLVSKPEELMNRICEFLSIAFEKQMLEPQENYLQLGDVSLRTHHDNLKNPINKNSIGKWKKELTKEQLITFDKIGLETLKKFNYV